MDLITTPLKKEHIRNNFSCGHPVLDAYIKTYATQDVKRNLSASFVFANPETNEVEGYYTLSSHSISRDEFPDELKKRIPPGYQEIPTVLLGRLARDINVKGLGLGELLLLDAFERCKRAAEVALGIVAIVVDPIDGKAEAFYAKYGFIKLPDSKRMFIPMKTVLQAAQG